MASPAVSGRRAEWQLREDCRKGNAENVRKAVLELKVNLNASDDLGQTPLWISAFHGRSDIVLFLLGNQATTEAATLKEGYTALWVACQEGHTDVVRLLLNAGANPNIQSKVDGATPMYIAAQKGMSEIVKLLIAANADIDCTMSYGTTPLWIACQNGHTDVVRLLLTYPPPSRKRPNTEAQEVNSKATPLYIAAQKGFSKIVELLLQNNAFVDAQTKEGATPVYIACQNGHFDVVRALLQFNANLQIKYKNTGTPLLIAMQRGHQEIVELLQKALRRSGSGDLPSPTSPSPRAGADAGLPRTASTPTASPKKTDFITARPSSQATTPTYPRNTSAIISPGAIAAGSTGPKSPVITPSRPFPQPPAKNPNTQSVQFKLPPDTASESVSASTSPTRQDPPPQQARTNPIPISPRSAASQSMSSSHTTQPVYHTPPSSTAVASSAPDRLPVSSFDQDSQPKNFGKVFVKIDGVNRRLSDFKAASLEDFTEKIRTQLNVALPPTPQFELYDDDAEDYFLVEKWSVFKDENSVVKLRLLAASASSDAGSDPALSDEFMSELEDEPIPVEQSTPVRSGILAHRNSRAAIVLAASPVITHPAARHASQPRLSPVVTRVASPSKRSGSTPAQRSPLVSAGSPSSRAAASPSRIRPMPIPSMKFQFLDDLLGDVAESPLGAEGEAQLLAGIERYSISYTELQFGEKIGSGTFGDVFIGRWHGAVVAIKLSRAISKKQRLDFLNEIMIMTSLTAHPHLITLMGICLNGEYPALVLEYADGGTLEKYVKQNLGSLNEAEIVRIAREIALGMRHLHRSGIIHRDLAIRNVLMNASSPPTCKISDFGLSRQWDSERSMTDSTSGLPIRWMSPESLDTREYSFASDSWAFGCLLVELMTGKVPYPDIGDLDVGIRIRDTNIVPTLPPHTPSIISSICKACWDRNPTKRPSFDVISEVLLNYKPL